MTNYNKKILFIRKYLSIFDKISAMSFSSGLIYRFAQGMLGLACVFSLLGTLLTTACVIFSFKPYIHLDSGSIIGLSDYAKGIPFTTHTGTQIPDTSFYLEYQAANGTKRSPYVNSYYGDLFAARYREIRLPETGDSLIYGDTIISEYRWIDFEKDPAVHTAEISSMTFYIWPENLGKRLLLFLPTLLGGLALAFCCWHLSRLMQHIVDGEAFRNRGYKRLAYVGYAILLLELVYFFLSFTGPFTHSISIGFHSTIPHFRTVVPLSGHPPPPFDLAWTAGGCILLIIAKGFQKGDELQKEQDLTI